MRYIKYCLLPGRFCQNIPFAPSETGLVYQNDPLNPMTLVSDFSLYVPPVPLEMKFFGSEFCGDNKMRLMMVASVPAGSKANPEIVMAGEGDNEALHVELDIDLDYVKVWGVNNGTKVQEAGEPGDGTTIDVGEPFIML